MPNIEDIKEFLAARAIEVWEFAEPTPTSIGAAWPKSPRPFS